MRGFVLYGIAGDQPDDKEVVGMPKLSGLRVGGHVIYVDAEGRQNDAVVTAIWGDPEKDVPCINVVFVSGDPARSDSYGRQIERETSVVHRSNQLAHGRYYMMPGDTPNPVAAVQR